MNPRFAHLFVTALVATTSALPAAIFRGIGDLSGFTFDTTPPIVESAQSSKLVTTRKKLRLRGTVYDEGGVTLVQAKIGGHPFRTISTTANWALKVRVKPRKTRVQIRAIDTAGNVSTTRRFVITKVYPL